MNIAKDYEMGETDLNRRWRGVRGVREGNGTHDTKEKEIWMTVLWLGQSVGPLAA